MTSPLYYLGFADGASHWTQNLESFVWAIYTPTHMLIHSTHVWIGPATKYQVEYDATYHNILHLCIHLDSQLLVSQLNRTYIIHDPILFRRFLHVEILFRQFDTINFVHIPRNSNTYVDTLANDILDEYLSHISASSHLYKITDINTLIYRDIPTHIIHMSIPPTL